MSYCERLEVLPPDVNLVSLEVLILDHCYSLRSFPHISTNIRELDLSGTAIEKVPSWIENMSKLKELDMSNCNNLEVLPTYVNLESLEKLKLACCYQLRSFPQISTSITELTLRETAIGEVPSWIENMSKLKELDMSDCKRLKTISVGIFKLRHLRKASFVQCSELTSFSDANVVATVAGITDSLDFPSNHLKHFYFNKCFKLDQNAQKFILRVSIPMFTFLPGGEVPMYFTHRSYDSSLIINFPQSSPFHEVMRLKACIVIESSGSWVYLKVGWRFRGLSGVILFDNVCYERDHMFVFNFGLADFELNSHPFASAAVDYDNMEFEVFGIDDGTEFEISIKRCGIRLLNASLR